ncbi:sodium:solute symporter family transporter [Candidatus Cardinium hertigii]|uniref:sodium:solute symporter family transporter n=1 Tax=Candidatus Cardinium hertigii TaxID=247481 RepID=UPI001FA9E62B|nr:hypothetical protein [Candidatus Cardinium hertigii]
MLTRINIPLFMVVTFLLLTLVVGIYFSRKTTSFQQYALGNKKFSTSTLVATVLATAYSGGGLVRNVEQVYKLGLYWIMVLTLAGFSLYIVSWLALRMGRFMHHLSMPETIGSVYGRYARIITTLSGICDAIAMIAAQVSAMSLAISMCLDVVNPKVITIGVTLILIFYSSFGGIRAVVFTDILQFITFTIIIPILAWLMFKSTGKSVVEMIPFLQSQVKFQFSTVCHFDSNLVAMLFLVLSFLMGYIEPPTIQRVYMSSSSVQAGKVFLYSTLFGFIINIFIILIALFVFVGAPDLPGTAIWGYIMANVPPIFKGIVCISLLAMAMSTADSKLNACAVMISHDMLQSLRSPKKAPYPNQLRLATCTSVVIGLFAMALTLYCNDLLRLLKLSLDFSLPIATAPFILAVLGFRGKPRTALIGILTGILSILAWNKWIEPKTGINGSFICMLANGIAMMAAHYLMKQPDDVGWVRPSPNDPFTQIQQVNRRQKAARNEAIKNGLRDIKNSLAKLQPSHVTLTCMGLYVVITNSLTYLIASITDYSGWLILQLLVGACFLGYNLILAQKVKTIPGWMVGLCWVIGLAFCLPMNVVWHWWHGTTLFLNVGLCLAHLSVSLFVLPLYLGVGFLIATLLMVSALSPIYCAHPLALVLSPSAVACLLLLYLGLGLLILGIFIYLKAKSNTYLVQVHYLKEREKITTSQKLKQALYDATIVPTTGVSSLKGHGAILSKVVDKMEESISFLDSNMPLYKEDFKSIIHKLHDWVTYFSKKEKAKSHALLQPTKISLDKLIQKVEFALSQEVPHPPRLLIKKINSSKGVLCPDIICDINQVVYSLVKAVLRVMGKLDGTTTSIVSIQLHHTALQFKQADAIDDSDPTFMLFQATGLLIHKTELASKEIPQVKPVYIDIKNQIDYQSIKSVSPSIDLERDMVASMVYAHYGYLEYPDNSQQQAILVVLPIDVTNVRDKLMIKLPIDYLISETPVTPKEQADSMMKLMQFHDYVCGASHQVDPIDVSTISNLLLLLRQYFGFKRHGSGQLFYVRAIGIARLVVEWVFHSPKVIYASLLYELVHQTYLPLSYIKEHYNLDVYAFVLNILNVDKRETLDHPSLLYVRNRFKEAIKKDHIQLSVLFIKLAERLYDLRHAAGYIMLEEIKYMANEALTVDVKLAEKYLAPNIAAALATAAQEALKAYHEKKIDRLLL